MAVLTLPVAIDLAYLSKSARELEKSALAASLKECTRAFEKFEPEIKKLDLSKVELPEKPADSPKFVQDLSNDVRNNVVKPLQAFLSGPLKKVEDEANKALVGEAKKAGKETVVKGILAAIKPFRTQAGKLIDEIGTDLEGLAKGVKKAPAKDEGDKKDVKPNKDLVRYNNLARKALRELRSGKIKTIPFYFAAHKLKTAFKKGSKTWDNKSLLHIHAKAGPSSRAMLVKLTECPSPIIGFGEIRCEDRKKLIFDCASPAANPKQIKDAMLFQCGWAPPFKVVKGGKVEGQEELGDGEDSGETLPEDDDEGSDTAVATAAPATSGQPAGTTTGDAGGKAGDAADAADKALKDKATDRFKKSSKEIQTAMAVGDRKAKGVRDLAMKVAEEIGKSGSGKEADKLMTQLDELLATPASVVTAAADVIGAAADSPELQQLIGQLQTLRTRAVGGVTRVAELIRKAYEGDPQAAKAVEGAKRVDASKNELKADVERQIATVLNTADKANRARLASQVRANVAKYRGTIAGHDLLGDIDGSDFDKNLKVIAPYVEALARAEALLGNIKA
jgi:hypothetical protein